MKHILSIVFIMLFSFNAFSSAYYDASLEEPISFNEAFKIHPMTKGMDLSLSISAEPGHYLYTESIEAEVLGVGAIEKHKIKFNNTEIKNDDYYGESIVLVDGSEVRFNISTMTNVDVRVKMQGCSSQGVCYMPQIFTYKYTPDALDEITAIEAADETPPAAQTDYDIPFHYIVLGFLIALTPCTYPIIGVTLGAFKNNTTINAVSYSVGVISAFTAVGTLAVIFGASVLPKINSFETSMVLGLIVIMLGISMIANKNLIDTSNLSSSIDKTASMISFEPAKALLIGAASGVLLTPCTSAPLLTVLIELSQINNTVYTINALVLVGLGLTLPLLAIAIVGTKVFKKPGEWMNTVKLFLCGAIISYGVYLPLSKTAIYSPYYLDIFSITILIVFPLVLGLNILFTKANTKKRSLSTATLGFILTMHTLISSNEPSIKMDNNELSNAEQLMSGTKIVKVQADWCTNCKKNSEVMANIDFVGIEVLTLDITEVNEFEQGYINQHNVLGIPLIHVYENGKLTKTHKGLITETELSELLNF